eukprot:COSAG01_NODE_1247_length_11073_cov_23.273465_8_plen_43_part_00
MHQAQFREALGSYWAPQAWTPSLMAVDLSKQAGLKGARVPLN